MSAAVLLADDNLDIRLFYAETLKGLNVDIAEGGFALLDRATQRAYALILTDLTMPDLSGAEALKSLRASPGPNQLTPVFAVTGDPSLEARQEMHRAGFDAYLEKPIRPAVLITLCRWASQ